MEDRKNIRGGIMIFDNITWDISSNSKLGFIDFGDYCATIYTGNDGKCCMYNLPFEVNTYKKDTEGDNYLTHLGARSQYIGMSTSHTPQYILDIPKESRVTLLSEIGFLSKDEVEDILQDLNTDNTKDTALTEQSILEELDDLQTEYYANFNKVPTKAILPSREYNFLLEELKERLLRAESQSMLTKPIKTGKLTVYLRCGMVEIECDSLADEIRLDL